MMENKNVEIENKEEIVEAKESKFNKIKNKVKNINIKNVAKGVGLTALGAVLGVVGYTLVENRMNEDFETDDDFEEIIENESDPEE